MPSSRLFDEQRASGLIMAEPQVIHIRGENTSLVHATIERLLRTDAHIVVGQSLLEAVKISYSGELEYSQASISSNASLTPSPGHRVLLFGPVPFESAGGVSKSLESKDIEFIQIVEAAQQEEPNEWVDARVCIHDMIPMRVDPFSIPVSFNEWLEALKTGEEPFIPTSQEHWWVAELDVADALVRMLICGRPFPSSCTMTGRRAWSMQQTYGEFSLLYKRTMAGQSGAFGVEELTAAPTPTIELQPLVITDQQPISIEENMTLRPDLSSVHEALHHADGDGWRPLIPIRTSLMHCLASML